MDLSYVDNLLIIGTSLDAISLLKTQLHDTFTIKDLGLARFFLGLELFHTSQGLLVHQCKFLLDLLIDAGLSGYKSVSQPLPTRFKLDYDAGDPLSSPIEYRRLIG